MRRVSLTNGGVLLDLHWVAESHLLAESLLDFLQPWFIPTDLVRPSDITLSLRPSVEFDATRRKLCTEAFSLRRSSAAIFNLEVKRGVSADMLNLAWDESREVGYVIDTSQAKVDFYGDAGTAFIHLIELVRYYGLLIEQSNGTVLLHSSAVKHRVSDEVIAIIGAKGAGKTTTMLSLLTTGEFVYFSGDKVLLDCQGGHLRARGWPDYPHVGIGTLKNHTALAKKLGVFFETKDGVKLPDDHKLLFEPSHYLNVIGKPSEAYGRLSRVILPRIHEQGSEEQTAIGRLDKDCVPKNDLFEWPHKFVTATWHGLPAVHQEYSTDVSHCVMDALKNLPWDYQFGLTQAKTVRTAEGAPCRN